MKMIRCIWQRILLAAVLVLVVSAIAEASTLAPSWRGESGSTYQKWSFFDGSNPAQPEVSDNTYGTASATITVGDFGEGWIDTLPGFGSRTGWWDLGMGGTISINIPNNPNGGSSKDLWVLVTYFEDIWPEPGVSVQSAGQQEYLGQDIYELEPVNTGGAWKQALLKWKITPNPDSEQVVFTADMMAGGIIDQIEIDTRCVPEPSSIAGLIVGVLGLVSVRRRRA